MCECYLCSISVDTCLSEINFQEFSLLLGNGILRAHPQGKQLTFNVENIHDKLTSIYSEFCKSSLDKDCPETFLQFVRIELSYAILEWYQEKIKDLGEETEAFSTLALTALKDFVRQFKNLFTLNYDPISYKSIFSETANFNDGFVNPKKSHSELIEKNLPETGGMHYLHGAFHIIYEYAPHRVRNRSKSPHLYKKITANKSSVLINEIIKKHKEIIDYWRHEARLDSKESYSYEDAFCVLESKSLYKKAWICNDPYLRLCYKRLGKQDRILSVGCSFKFDDHILERILRNPNLECLYIGIYSEQDQKNICSAYKRISESPMNATYMSRLEENIKKIKFVCTKKLSQVIWPNAS